MRIAWATMLACALAAAFAAAPAAGDDQDTLRRYAAGTWASMAAMTDPASGLPPTSCSPTAAASPDVDDEHRRVPVERGRRGAARHHRQARAARARRADADHARGHGAPRPSGQFFNWYDHRDRREAHPLAADRRRADADPLLGRQRLARRRPADRGQRRPGALRPRERALRLDGLRGSTTGPRATGSLPLRARHRRGAVLLRHDRLREPDRDYVGIAKGDLPSRVYYGPWRTFPDSCDYAFQETRPAGFTRTYEGVSVYEGAYPTATRGSSRVGAGACSRR